MTESLATLAELLRDTTPPDASSGDLPAASGNTMLHMDNLQAMARIASASLDFVYLDPPFASSADYVYRIQLPGHTIRQRAYVDTWSDGLNGYLRYLVPRLIAVRRLLKPTATICVHLDGHSSHYIKLAMDAIFGADRLVNEIVWRYGKMSNTSRRFPQNHDTLLVYAAGPEWYFQPVRTQPSEYRTRYARDLTGNQVLFGTVKHRSDKLLRRRITARTRELGRDLVDTDVLFDFDDERKVQDDVFTDISIVRGNAHEGTGYDTQKPQQLLERLIHAFTPADGIVADFFGGSGTTAAAAQALGRRWILADIGLPAIQVARVRLRDADARLIRDPSLAPGAFVVDARGAITDFRLADLALNEVDSAAVAHLLDARPAALIAGTIGSTVIDVFGREATLPR